MDGQTLKVLNELKGSLWHTTNLSRFKQIVKDGGISPHPSVPDEERWCASVGTDGYSFVRTLKGVSLFDFENFDEIDYHEKYTSSSWRQFVPCCRNWEEAIWIELNRNEISKNLIGCRELVEIWHEKKDYQHTIMPMLEAAHIGVIPLSAFRRIFIFRRKDSTLSKIDMNEVGQIDDH